MCNVLLFVPAFVHIWKTFPSHISLSIFDLYMQLVVSGFELFHSRDTYSFTGIQSRIAFLVSSRQLEECSKALLSYEEVCL